MTSNIFLKIASKMIVMPIRIFVESLATFVFLFPLLTLVAGLSRLKRKPIDIGLGPEPLINNLYHKAALERYGYRAETFVHSVYYITDDFDFRGDKLTGIRRILLPYFLFVRSIFRYRAIYIYFNGGPLSTSKLRWMEAFLFKVAQIRIVVMPYGSDVQDFGKTPSLLFRHATTLDYPGFKSRRSLVSRQVDYWITHANHVVSGCDWVYYMHHWDTLMLGHFSIDVDQWLPAKPAGQSVKFSKKRPLRLFHAPNHRNIKGTHFFVAAVEQLKRTGIHVELILKSKVPNREIRAAMQDADVILDQLVVGWYAMFSIEAMAMGKPVVCFLAPDLLELYEFAGIVEHDHIPIIQSDVHSITQVLERIYEGHFNLTEIGKQSREFVERYHSLQAVGKQFDQINKSMGVEPQTGVSS